MSHQKIKNVMSTHVAAVRTDTPFKEVARILERRDVSAVPVVDDGGRVLGVVSEADLLVKQGTQDPMHSRSPLARLLNRRAARLIAATTAAQLMTAPAITINAETTVARAARLLTRKNIKRLPVVDAEGTLLGIVSRKDLLTVFLRKDEDIRDDVVKQVFERGIGLAVNPTTVTITVHDGEVTVVGQLELKSQIPLVVQMISHLDGVVDVNASLAYLHDDTKGHVPDPLSFEPRLR